MPKLSKELKELKKLEEALEPFRTFSPGRGHVSYLCASRVVPKGFIANGWPPGFRTQRLTVTRPTWVISGRDTTSTEGQATIDICEYLEVPECAPVGFQAHEGPAIIDGRPAFFASLHSDEPVVVTSKIEATVQAQGENWWYRDMFDGHFYSGDEVEYKVTATVRAWKLDGSPAKVDFSWLCIAEAAVRYREY